MVQKPSLGDAGKIEDDVVDLCLLRPSRFEGSPSRNCSANHLRLPVPYLNTLADLAGEQQADGMLNVTLLIVTLFHRRRTLAFLQLAFRALTGIATREACQGKAPITSTNL